MQGNLKIDFSKVLYKKPPQSIINPVKFNGKVKEFDPNQHDIVGETKDHHNYNCPFCEEARGKVDDDGKLYWNYEKLIGYCFKCETVAILETDKSRVEVLLEMGLNRILSSLSSNLDVISNEFRTLTEIDKNIFDSLDDRALKYLESRNPFYPSVSSDIQLKCISNMGVVFPVVINGKLVSYSLRFFNPKGKMKYYLPETSKLVYSPTQEIYTGNRLKEITLVEGSFDAFACLIDGFENPMAIFGKSLTPLQAYIIRSLSPDTINIYMDETDLSFKLLRKAKQLLPTVPNFRIIRSSGYDSEERLNWKIKNTSADYLNKLLSNLENINKRQLDRSNLLVL